MLIISFGNVGEKIKFVVVNCWTPREMRSCSTTKGVGVGRALVLKRFHKNIGFFGIDGKFLVVYNERRENRLPVVESAGDLPTLEGWASASVKKSLKFSSRISDMRILMRHVGERFFEP